MPDSTGSVPEPQVCDKAIGLGRVGLALSTAARGHRLAAARELRDIGLYPGQEVVLQHLNVNGPSRPCDIVTAVNLDPSTVTRMIQRLEKSGFVERRSDPDDRRATLVSLSQQGEAIIDKARQAWRSLEQRTGDGLSAAEQDQLVRLLERVEANLAPCAEGMDEVPE
ncbi:MarR family winged helix-turn-helix transcriptional regulator [Haloglycomyces albus]|uniref:MarR family winged helix-turn-helix transcriptional regulator n=1 Tax=Haloglycomyces albus TaxID=526067 RepID=UPI00046C9B25|nr:MarR family transcriptional regulator [Haloglycomyces albus]